VDQDLLTITLFDCIHGYSDQNRRNYFLRVQSTFRFDHKLKLTNKKGFKNGRSKRSKQTRQIKKRFIRISWCKLNFQEQKLRRKLWEYIKSNKLQTKTENGKPENAGKFIVADAKLLTIFNNTHTTSKTGKVTDLRNLKEGETINMMQMASVVGANIE
jgi:hypothetical protein